ncbi:ATP synthase F1 subunit gamma [Candidatus Giovannonibacteria bacterium RIFCSPLOWO2_02_FULL_43_11b]|uniref:ATP synthase gamma chain n=1 Tax=Candidatus Giovannonibacteria bacterium RIFCSPHIGHO2_12_FULL_43_15 TaxID=1798341 RepID=A0A1F5WNK9_9BACT|nr:MAG: ATP synthase F1 subunit gamma [Candidatus Giovannonibacteria bacterium RIFCSPHIGHO2_01_FULL_43_100]OGF67562.1 MAG: ATP synthase F1 subunit gamma [Candidatus Giovannonibacteria bacterium RIFCSPHIGHO2_02_FULL_43_32]OGF77235.1 MAG: ATP synthase F1 subunit gamma [Candidatus Giovannonibacteria bacterium RIFCSPHIGHO2_12_FULL_43_15]OGF79062.1 MAG: ATP synthase F1 subunit gamma [Candidatus Giovannonibacteria bacterium RIFCSPLOWO2_01_FULL_43_60]OGF90641.1 MAG: ATP synthase F1 subunit gamma [Cand
MESLQNLNRRRKAVRSIGAITKAMEVVAAIKMRKGEETTLNSRPYAFKVLDLLEKLGRVSGVENVFTKVSPSAKTLVILITSDRGLIGAFNTQVLRAFENFIARDRGDYIFAAVGKKAESHLLKKGFDVLKKFYGFGDFIKVEEIAPLADFVTGGFISEKWGRVVVTSMHFRSALKQETIIREILPLDFRNIRKTILEIIPEHGRWAEFREKNGVSASDREIDYIFEPSSEKLMENLMPHLLRMKIYHLVLEANASEHAARYVAMKSASDNAEDLSGKLLIQFNNARQAAITGEMVEMSATQSALK